MKKNGKFAKFLDMEFIDYQKRMGGSKQQNEFAAWFGIDPVVLNRHINGIRVPKPDDPVILKYVDKLGPRVYDALGLARPDHLIEKFIYYYDMTPDGNHEELINRVAEIAKELGYGVDRTE